MSGINFASWVKWETMQLANFASCFLVNMSSNSLRDCGREYHQEMVELPPLHPDSGPRSLFVAGAKVLKANAVDIKA